MRYSLIMSIGATALALAGCKTTTAASGTKSFDAASDQSDDGSLTADDQATMDLMQQMDQQIAGFFGTIVADNAGSTDGTMAPSDQSGGAAVPQDQTQALGLADAPAAAQPPADLLNRPISFAIGKVKSVEAHKNFLEKKVAEANAVLDKLKSDAGVLPDQITALQTAVGQVQATIVETDKLLSATNNSLSTFGSSKAVAKMDVSAGKLLRSKLLQNTPPVKAFRQCAQKIDALDTQLSDFEKRFDAATPFATAQDVIDFTSSFQSAIKTGSLDLPI